MFSPSLVPDLVCAVLPTWQGCVNCLSATNFVMTTQTLSTWQDTNRSGTRLVELCNTNTASQSADFALPHLQ